jgi:aminomethyltransferase
MVPGGAARELLMAEIAEPKPLPLDALPLDALHRRLGARMVPFAGHAMPIQYEGIVAEHRWTRAHAGLFDVSHMGQLVLAGAGAAQWLESLAPGDWWSMGPPAMRISPICAPVWRRG